MKITALLSVSLFCAAFGSHGQLRTYQPQPTPTPATREVYEPRPNTEAYEPRQNTEVYQPRQNTEVYHPRQSSDGSTKTYSPTSDPSSASVHTHHNTNSDGDLSTSSSSHSKTAGSHTRSHASPSEDTGDSSSESKGKSSSTPSKKTQSAGDRKASEQSEKASASADVARHRTGLRSATASTKPHTNAHPGPGGTTASGQSDSGSSTYGDNSGNSVTVVTTVGGVDPRVNAFYANEAAQYELSSQVLEAWNNALAIEFATAPDPLADSVEAPDAAPAPDASTAVSQNAPPPVVYENETVVTRGGPVLDQSSKLLAASTVSSTAAASPTVVASADDSQPPAGSPAPASAQLLSVSETDLSKQDRLEYETLLTMAFQLQTLPAADVTKAETAFLDRSDIYLKAHPDERALWLVRARLALHADLPPVGVSAGANLQRLGTFDDPKMHGLMVAMNMRKWLPATEPVH